MLWSDSFGSVGCSEDSATYSQRFDKYSQVLNFIPFSPHAFFFFFYFLLFLAPVQHKYCDFSNLPARSLQRCLMHKKCQISMQSMFCGHARLVASIPSWKSGTPLLCPAEPSWDRRSTVATRVVRVAGQAGLSVGLSIQCKWDDWWVSHQAVSASGFSLMHFS